MKFYEYILLFFQATITLLTVACSECSNSEYTEDNNTDSIPTINVADINDTNSDADRREDSILQSLGMVRIDDSLPEVIVDIKYATDDNFIGFDFYSGFKHAYVQPECLAKLKKAYMLLRQKDSTLTFVVFDAARSIESQQLMWDSIVPPPGYGRINFVADPSKGSIHNYGMALDIGIAELSGNYLDMGTKFDYFGELAYPRFTEHFHNIGELSDEQYHNRNLLMDIMKQAGFFVSKSEWWHYNASGLERAKRTYEIYSLSSN